jgi:hypothetical protein
MASVKCTPRAGVRINRIGRSFIRTPNRDLVLNNVHYVPEASKNLASVHRLTSNNHAFMEFHPNYFLIKDLAMKKILLRGNCKGGLYSLKSGSSSNKVTCGAIKSSTRWHNRLGHPSFVVVEQVLSTNNIPFVS